VPDLDERDPDFIRERLPGLWLLSSLYFRGDVRGLGNIPDDGQVLLVGNHSGGTTTPDTLVLVSAFSTYFSVERPLFAITRFAPLSWPPVSWLRRFGVVGPTPGALGEALRTGASVLVYPGGEEEVHRPSWEAGRVDLGEDTSWVAEALRRDVPVVPVVAAGGQETALFLGRRAGAPVSIALPWVVHVGSFAGNVPLPAKLTVEVLHPIDLRATYGPDADPADIRDDIQEKMQRMLTTLQRGRRLPVIG
jgi:1-acyl-sn-glycerol-3-phosphate acyltransferase